MYDDDEVLIDSPPSSSSVLERSIAPVATLVSSSSVAAEVEIEMSGVEPPPSSKWRKLISPLASSGDSGSVAVVPCFTRGVATSCPLPLEERVRPLLLVAVAVSGYFLVDPDFPGDNGGLPRVGGRFSNAN